MNAAARLVHQGAISRQYLLVLSVTKRQKAVFMLATAVLLSALATIYITHVSRLMHAGLQHSLFEQDRLHVEHGQLLLERSAWMMQGRIQTLAENKLGMVIPDSKSVVIVQE